MRVCLVNGIEEAVFAAAFVNRQQHWGGSDSEELRQWSLEAGCKAVEQYRLATQEQLERDRVRRKK